MLEQRPLVSIGMPVYNGARFLSQALEALVAQDYDHTELIISDNASTDATPDICRAYAARDPRIRYSRTVQNEGAIGNFNRVLELSVGDYFMWAAADDLWEPAYVSSLLKLLEVSPQAVLAFCAFDNIDERGSTVRIYPHLFELPATRAYSRLRNYLLQDEALGKANVIYGLTRRSALEAAGGFRVWGRGRLGADMLVVGRLLSFGTLTLTGEVLFHKRLPVDPSAGGHERRARASLAARAAALWDWLGYFSGYARIIGVSPNLTAGERVRLYAALMTRAGGFCWKSLRRVLIGAGAPGAPQGRLW